MLTAAEPVRLYEAPRGCPSAAQRAAVDRAEARAAELHRGLLTPLWIWAHAPSAAANAVTRFPAFGAVVYIRDDLSPAQVYKTGLHELMHVADEKLIVSDVLTAEEAERRARHFVGYATMTGETTMGNFSELSDRVDALVARGMSWSHAWELVARQRPPRIAAPAASAGTTRHGYHPALAGFPPIPACVCGGYLIRTGLGKIRECGWCKRQTFD